MQESKSSKVQARLDKINQLLKDQEEEAKIHVKPQEETKNGPSYWGEATYDANHDKMPEVLTWETKDKKEENYDYSKLDIGNKFDPSDY